MDRKQSSPSPGPIVAPTSNRENPCTGGEKVVNWYKYHNLNRSYDTWYSAGGRHSKPEFHVIEFININTISMISPALARSRRRRIRGIYKHYTVFDSFYNDGSRFLLYGSDPHRTLDGDHKAEDGPTTAIAPSSAHATEERKKEKATGRSRRPRRGRRERLAARSELGPTTTLPDDTDSEYSQEDAETLEWAEATPSAWIVWSSEFHSFRVPTYYLLGICMWLTTKPRKMHYNDYD
ncbi:hypothetical protein QBC39DRAFT_332590 [Podospora conica]|nr:hypothetical protein QBC39DRAFT_332590 [Schizothecium conicum]